jgi:pyrimidine operon attenuation protein/uracil phosphoribosyltransferase
VKALVEQARELERENARLRARLSEREKRVQLLDHRILELNQRRQDVAKRIDDLITQIDQLESRSGTTAAP